ncbi:Major facilitator superfamily domain, general substrate transporter [Pseudocohnilembus persalinus]|uniref:Hexose transporter 1 n=1 Tax=Pseudocohnilembus persalinus TaxID=266149 RepID=A0A0V0QM02_PSEPJ|nr:Major facilitator superfamily domain, general substrate transporter [Pseudocohnilembus persalinus]|eukprot:KRX03282.1 Major facilitator superfamily domain, general substrate transporter [Pseudocohnilembus persalinus]
MAQTDISENNTPQKHISTALVFVQAISACLGSFYFGYALGELNMAEGTLMSVYNITSNQDLYYGMLTSAVPLGAVLGCLIVGYMLDSFGRRMTFIIIDIIAIGISFIFLISNFWVSVVCRFIQGILVGVNSTVVPLYLREVSPVSISGSIGVLNQGSLNTGILVGYILGLGFPLASQQVEIGTGFFQFWRLLLFFPFFTSCARLILLFFKFKQDTAQFYLLRNNSTAAKEVIQAVYQEEFHQEILDEFKQEALKKKENNDTWSLVFSSFYSKRLIIGSLVSFFQQFCGINAIVFYSNSIFTKTSSEETANIMTVVSGALLVAFSFGSSIFSSRFGRKPILTYGYAFLMLCLIGAGIVSYLTKDNETYTAFQSFLSIFFVFCYEIGFSLTSGPLTWVYNADIINSEKALGVATMVNQFCAFIIGLVCPSLIAAWGIYTLFFIFAGICFLGTLFCHFYLKETFGKTQNQILAMFVDSDQVKEACDQLLNSENTNVSNP